MKLSKIPSSVNEFLSNTIRDQKKEMHLKDKVPGKKSQVKFNSESTNDDLTDLDKLSNNKVKS